MNLRSPSKTSFAIKVSSYAFYWSSMAKATQTLCHYVLDALDCLNSFDFQCYTTMTNFALTQHAQAVLESIWPILITVNVEIFAWG